MPVSFSTISPFGIDQTPSSRFCQKGPPGWTRSTSRFPSRRRWTSKPALWSLGARLVVGRKHLLAGADRDLEPVLWRRRRTAIGWVVRATGVVCAVEISRDVVAVRFHLQIAACAIAFST